MNDEWHRTLTTRTTVDRLRWQLKTHHLDFGSVSSLD